MLLLFLIATVTIFVGIASHLEEAAKVLVKNLKNELGSATKYNPNVNLVKATESVMGMHNIARTLPAGVYVNQYTKTV